MNYLIKGEGCEDVTGELSQEPMTGQPDFALRVESLRSRVSHESTKGMIGDDDDAHENKQEDSDDARTKMTAIMEVSIGKNFWRI